MVRLQALLLDGIDNWRRGETDLPGRPEAIRRLVERGLKAGGNTPKKAKR
jgi:hypothetical protein